MKKKPLDFKNSLILVVGDLLLDCYWYSQNKYISSKKITSILPINQVKEQPGGAANVAKNIAEIGGKSKIIGFIGMDHEGLILKKIMNHVRIYCDFIALRTQKTITKIRILSKKKQIIRVDFQEKYICNKSDILYKKIVDSLSSYKILVLSDYAKGTLLEIEKIINYANKISIPILIDPKGMNFTKYSGASLLTPNLSEFEKIVGKCYKECEIIQRGIRLLYELKLSALLVTRSKMA